MTYSIRPSTQDDFIVFYGHPPLQSCRAWTVIYDGDIAGIAGVTISRDALVFFSNINPDREYPKATIYKIGCYITERVAEMKKPVIAIGTKESHNFLTRLGFVHMTRFEDQELYQLWQG